MLLAVCLYSFATVICITIEATIFASIICANIDARHTAAFGPLVFILLDLELTMTEAFQPLLVNAAGMGDLKPVEIYCLCTGVNVDAIVMRSLRKSAQ